MKCPKLECDTLLIWQCDFDVEEDEHVDADGEPFTIQSFWDCPKCSTQVCIFD